MRSWECNQHNWLNFHVVGTLKARYHLLTNVILRLRNNIIIMYFDRYLSCFGIKNQIIFANLYKLKIEHRLQRLLRYNKPYILSHIIKCR